MSAGAGARFVLRAADGGEVSLGSVEELQDRIAAGGVAADADLFDASTGRWAPAREVPVFLFILEELAAEGRLPSGLRPLLGEGPAPDEPPSAGEASGPSVADPFLDSPQEPRPDDALAGAETGFESLLDEDGLDAVEDAFSIRMDLVGPDPPEAGAGPGEVAGPAPEVPGPAPDDRPDPRPAFPAPLPGGSEDPTAESDRAPGEEPPAEGPPAPAAEPVAEATGGPEDEDRPDGFTLDLNADFAPLILEPDAPRQDDEQEWRERAKKSDEDPWFMPSSEGGMVLTETEESPAATWEPDSAEAPSPVRPAGTSVRARVIVPLVMAGLAGALWIVFSSASEAGETLPEALPERAGEGPVIPPVPEDLAASGARVLARIDVAFARATDATRARFGLERDPPAAWLSGYYLANARQFPGVVTFWETYVDFLGEMRDQDREVYRTGVQAALTAEPLGQADRERLGAYFDDRYARQAAFRRQRYEDLADAARASLDLHEVLARHEAAIAFSPALGRGVSADPILEAVIPEGPVRREVDAALDRVFHALDRSRGGGPPSRDGLRAELFESFGDPY
jgi:hypothetical protein